MISIPTAVRSSNSKTVNTKSSLMRWKRAAGSNSKGSQQQPYESEATHSKPDSDVLVLFVCWLWFDRDAFRFVEMHVQHARPSKSTKPWHGVDVQACPHHLPETIRAEISDCIGNSSNATRQKLHARALIMNVCSMKPQSCCVTVCIHSRMTS